MNDDPHNVLFDGLGALQNPGDSLPSLIVDLEHHLGIRRRLGFLVLYRLILGVAGLLAVLGLGVLSENVGRLVLGIDSSDRFEDLDLSIVMTTRSERLLSKQPC